MRPSTSSTGCKQPTGLASSPPSAARGTPAPSGNRWSTTPGAPPDLRPRPSRSRTPSSATGTSTAPLARTHGTARADHGRLGAAGVLTHSSRAQYSGGRKVSRSELQPGDLVFFYSPISHVGLYIGDGQMIHASNEQAGSDLVDRPQWPVREEPSAPDGVP